MQAIYEKWIWMWIIVCFCGCSDDALQDTLLKVSAPPAMTGVPIEIQELLWDDPEEEKEKLRLILQHPDDHPDWVTQYLQNSGLSIRATASLLYEIY